MAIKTVFEVFDILDPTADYSISATDKNNVRQTVITSNYTLQYITHKYGTRRYSLLTGGTPATVDDATSAFLNDFRMWLLNRQKNIDLQYQALFDYPFSPIENYDRYENETISRENSGLHSQTETNSGTDTTTYGKVDTTTKVATDATSGEDTTTKNGEIQNETDKSGFNSPGTYTPDVKNVEYYDNVTESTDYGKTNTINDTTTERITGSDGLQHGHVVSTSGSESGEDESERTLHSHGNIGVTQATEMIQNTVDLYAGSFAEMLIDNFINDFTFYS